MKRQTKPKYIKYVFFGGPFDGQKLRCLSDNADDIVYTMVSMDIESHAAASDTYETHQHYYRAVRFGESAKVYVYNDLYRSTNDLMGYIVNRLTRMVRQKPAPRYFRCR